MPVRVGINGFGRIGRIMLRASLDNPDIQIMAINDLADPETLAYLFYYDSVHGRYESPVEAFQDSIMINNWRIPIFGCNDPAEIKWSDHGVDIVIEATGAFRSRDRAARHLDAGAKKVIISAPSDDADATFVYGVNEESYDPASHQVVSNASCTTNALAPVVKVIHEKFGMVKGLMTTVHGYTTSQALLDTPTRKKRRSRAAALNIVPTSTGAAVAVGKVLPQLDGKLDGMALRTPNPDGSILDLTALLKKGVTAEEVNAAFDEAAETGLKGILRVSREQLVSSDILRDHHSSIVDAELTMAAGELVKVLVWYDNEWGYACRLIDIAIHMGRNSDLGH
jgi:glyceraldehyde 3-phosphate dehydrogenase